jgi:beta-N-acetylhexosaminidase
MTTRGGGARLMVGFHGTQVGDDILRVLDATGARSVILFARNIESAAQAAELIGELRRRADRPLLLAVDQEGGAVVRIARGATVFPGNMALGAAGSVELAESQGYESGRQLAALGFDLNLAPVVDLQTNPANPGIGIRSLGADLERAAPLAAALVRGHAHGGVGCCLKHFPGKGAAAVDAHRALPVLNQTLEEFRHPHLDMFERVIAESDPTAVMTSHVIVRGLDSDVPATFSRRTVTTLLREAVDFRGLILSDDLEMGAIVEHWGIADAAERALGAGHDIVLICHTHERQLEAARHLDGALRTGRLDPLEHSEALARIDAASARGQQAPRRAQRAEGERSQAGPPVDPRAGDAVARWIADRAVHVFADPGGLLPLSTDRRVSVLAFRPRSIVGVEEASAGQWELAVERAFRAAGFKHPDVRGLDLDGEGDSLPSADTTGERVVLLTWDARGQQRVRSALATACERYRGRLVVVHLRNPFDQALVPPDVTALTPFGYQRCQLEACAAVLAGALEARGSMPAPLV